MSAIARAFARCRAERRAAFVPFLVGGDPDLGTTEELVLALAAGGADLVEIGVPFSDPVADGPVNQAAAQRALATGCTLGRLLATVAKIRARTPVPIVLFSYFNPILRYGLERFAEHAAGSGVDGVLAVDLPPEEAEGACLEALSAAAIDPVFLLAPTSTRQRMKSVQRAGRGFVYYVSRTGVTGEREALSTSLAAEVKAVRKHVNLPLAVGFGISSPEQAAAVGRIADGVVVGSALVRLVEAEAGSESLPDQLRAAAGRYVSALRRR